MKKIFMVLVLGLAMVLSAHAELLKTGEGRYMSSDFDGVVVCYTGKEMDSFIQGLPTLVKDYQAITFTTGERHVAWADIQELFGMGYTSILAAEIEYDGEKYAEFFFLLDDGDHYATWIIPYDALKD